MDSSDANCLHNEFRKVASISKTCLTYALNNVAQCKFQRARESKKAAVSFINNYFKIFRIILNFVKRDVSVKTVVCFLFEITPPCEGFLLSVTQDIAPVFHVMLFCTKQFHQIQTTD